MEKKRCFWCNMNNAIYFRCHDAEWGVSCMMMAGCLYEVAEYGGFF